MYTDSFELFPILNFILFCIQKVRGELMQVNRAMLKAQKAQKRKLEETKIKPVKYFFKTGTI